jgi:hypothetical protein
MPDLLASVLNLPIAELQGTGRVTILITTRSRVNRGPDPHMQEVDTDLRSCSRAAEG